MNKIYSIAMLAAGIMALSLSIDSAYAQQPPPTVGGMPVPIDNVGLFASLVESNLLWIAPVAVGSIVLLKLRKRN
ncbi:MAG TPA: hypothetical protein VD731_07590 [Nitrosopumilaceae archaeon]|nr:hypothetical protein [Nitrosopumilaceae archaeon]